MAYSPEKIRRDSVSSNQISRAGRQVGRIVIRTSFLFRPIRILWTGPWDDLRIDFSYRPITFFGRTFRIGQSHPSDGPSFGRTFRIGQSHPSDRSSFGRTFCIGQTDRLDSYQTVINGQSLRSHPQVWMVRPSSLSCLCAKPYLVRTSRLERISRLRVWHIHPRR